MTTSTIQGIAVDPTPPVSGEGLIFNGTVYVPTPANPGDITAVNTTLPLTGGGVSGALTLDIDNFTGDGGAGGLDGAVPAPAAGDAAAGKFLKADGTWAAPGGGGAALLGSTKINVTSSTNSGVPVDLITAAVVSTGGVLKIEFGSEMGIFGASNANQRSIVLSIFVDAVFVTGTSINFAPAYAPSGAIYIPIALAGAISGVAAGAHTVAVKWNSDFGGLVYANGNYGSAATPTTLDVWEN